MRACPFGSSRQAGVLFRGRSVSEGVCGGLLYIRRGESPTDVRLRNGTVRNRGEWKSSVVKRLSRDIGRRQTTSLDVIDVIVADPPVVFLGFGFVLFFRGKALVASLNFFSLRLGCCASKQCG